MAIPCDGYGLAPFLYRNGVDGAILTFVALCYDFLQWVQPIVCAQTKSPGMFLVMGMCLGNMVGVAQL